MADEARAKRAAALEEKKRRLEQLKARRAERSATSTAASSGSAAAGGAASSAAGRGTGGNLDEYIDGLLKSEAPAVPGVEASKSPAAAADATAETSAMSDAARDGDEGEGSSTAPSSPDRQDAGTSTEAAAPAPVSAPVRKVETFTMATQTEDDDFPPPLSDEEDEEEDEAAAAAEKAKKEAEAAAADAAEASTENEQGGEKGTQTLPLPKTLDPSSVSKTITSRPFVTFLNSASKKVEKVLGAPALAELLDDPAYDDDVADDDQGVGGDGEAGGSAEGDDAAASGGAKRARRTKGRGGRGVLLGATSTDTLDATGIIKSCQTYSCPRWTDNRDITSITWSPHRREMLVASYQSSAAASSASSVDAAVRAVSPTDTPSSSLIPQSSELRSDGLALVWNLALPDRPEHIFCCGSPILTTAFHPTETRLLIGGCHSGQVVVWDVRAGRLPVQRSVGPSGGGHAHPICSMEVVEAGSALLTSATDGKINFWSLSNLREPAESLSVKANISMVGVAPESNALLCGDESGKIHAVIPPSDKSSSSKRTVRVLDSGEDGHFGMITGLSTKVPPKSGGHLARGFLRGSSGLVLTCGVDWTTKLWAPAYTDKPIQSYVSHSYDYMCDVQWSPTHPSLFATACGNGSLGFWNLASSIDEPLSGSNGIPIKEATGGGGEGGVLNKIRWSSDGRSIAVANSDRLHILGLSEDVARPKENEESKMMNNLKSRGFIDEE